MISELQQLLTVVHIMLLQYMMHGGVYKLYHCQTHITQKAAGPVCLSVRQQVSTSHQTVAMAGIVLSLGTADVLANTLPELAVCFFQNLPVNFKNVDQTKQQMLQF